MYISSMMFRILILFFFIFFKSSLLLAEIITDIKVKGNSRVSSETIINFSGIVIGQDVSQKQLNDSLKELYKTNFFKNVKFDISEKILIIEVSEYSIIQEIIITGVKAQKTIKKIKENLGLKEKNPFIESLIQNDKNKILNTFKQSGYYFVKIETKIEENSNDTVNIYYEIDTGNKATISKINFIGDKKYKNRKLRSVITSEEDKFWKFISNKKYLDIERVKLDKRLLKNFYLDKGYYQVEINDAYSQIINQESFTLTFNINSGNKFYFGDLKLVLPSDFDPNKFDNLNRIFKKLKNKKYSYGNIEKILDEIESIALFENYEFINANVVETVVDNRVNFIFEIEESEKVFVNKINIFGNNITSEEFIRNNLIVDEGDPFNKILHNKSLNKLRSKGIFGKVETKIIDTEETGLKDIEVIIEEKPTGEIMAGAGYGSDGSTFSVGIKENNFNGKGIVLESNLQLTEESIKGNLNYRHPNFRYSDRALSTSLDITETDKLKNFGYKSSLNSISLGTSYEQFENTFFSPRFSISSESLETTSDASTAYKKQEGSYFDSSFSYGLTFDKRNSAYQPTSGFYSSWYQQLPIISENQTITNGYIITGYKELADDMIVSTGIYTRAVNSLSDDDVRVSKRLYVPSSRLRGFESGKVGPKDGDDFIGGNYMTAINFTSTLPQILENSQSTDFIIFLDMANIWGVDYDSSLDDNEIRSSIGIGLDWYSPIGPMNFSLAQPITKSSNDVTQSFRFNLGTTF